MEWSSEQIGVINSRQNNTLVSASAGSGKTTVMLERLIRIITGDDFTRETVPIKNIVVVTFNNGVAQELRFKISKKLKEKFDATQNSRHREFLREQIEDLAVADISTLHSLCGNIIRQNFEAVGIDPSFGLLDDDGRETLFDKAVEDTLKKYRSDFSPTFESFARYCTDYEFKKIIKEFYEFVVAQPDRERYLDSVALLCTSTDLDVNPLVKRYVDKLNRQLQTFKDEARTLRERFVAEGDDEGVEYCDNFVGNLNNYGSFSTFDELLKRCAIRLDKVSFDLRRKAKPEVKEYRKEFNDLSKQCDKLVEKLNTYASIDYSAHRQAVQKCNETIKVLCNFTADVTARYLDLKQQENKLDFNDLEYYAVQALKNDDVAEAYRQKYAYVCVDEYQDINAVQEYILGKISNGKNLFMVGDSKQSIYAFRQTDTDIFLSKFDDYLQDPTQGQPHYLNANYRSSKDILQFVNQIFDVVMTKDFGGVDYRNTARLEEGQKAYEPTCDKPVQVVLFEEKDAKKQAIFDDDGVYSVRSHQVDASTKYRQESLWIAEKIKDLVSSGRVCQIVDGQPINRPIEYKDIAILFSSRNEQVDDLTRCLHYVGIPVDDALVVKNKSNASLNVVVDLLKVIDNDRQDVALASAMTGYFGGFGLGEMAEIRRMGGPLVAKSDRQAHFYQYVLAVRETDTPLGKKIRKFYDFIEKYRVAQTSLSVGNLIKKIIYDSGFDGYVLLKEGGKREFEELTAFVKNLKGKSFDRSLSDFLTMGDGFKKSSNSIATQTGDNCVKTLTMHASKGLEYPVVFVVNLDKVFNKDYTRKKFLVDKDFGVAMKTLDEEAYIASDNIVLDAMEDYKDKCYKEERMRLLYVALTRAKNMLFVTASVNSLDKATSSVLPENVTSALQWISYVAKNNDAFERKYISCVEQEACSEEETDESPLTFRLLPDSDVTDLEKALKLDYAYKESKTLGIKHTVTAINNIASQDKPKYERTDYGESGKNLIGTALHKAMELIDFGLQGREEVADYLDEMVRCDELSQEQRRMIDPQIIADCLLSPSITLAKNNRHFREKNFVLDIPACEVLDGVVTDDKILLQGTIDLLIELPEGYVIVDFKYSSKSDEEIKRTYAKQLELYQLAVESCSRKRVVGKYIVVIGGGREIKL
ncbi:MAG: UvrD-helicase domain-containing protein [Christensenellales bacterium]